MKRFRLLINIAFSMALPFNLFAQMAVDESKPYADAIQAYHQFLHPETGLYSGIQYNDYAYTIQEGTPFFDAVPFQQGSVVFKNILYENVFIAYDVVKENVVIYDAQHLYKLVLASQLVNRFVTSGHTFTHLTKDSAASTELRTGFYDVLYDGKTRVLKKEKRTVQESLSSSGVSKKYITNAVDYFIRKDNVYHNVNNKSALFSLFKKEKKEVKQWLRKKRLKFSRDKDEALVQAAIYYDSIAH